MRKRGITVLADIAKDKLEKTTKECQSLGSETISIECDVSNEMQISEAISEMAKQFDEIHAVINIAGIQLWSHSHEHSLTDFERTLAVNLTGTFLVCRKQFLPSENIWIDCQCFLHNSPRWYPLLGSLCGKQSRRTSSN
ncbi:MAG: hypothetical protein CM15mP49_29010 [Actinomycetota bacterium]|nr:MAG: hypothetical protein CM15mP49_29010 [Actinomycetota bacterium]